MGTMIRDPNAPPDPSEVAPIPDYQHAADDWVGAPHNQVAPGAPPSPDYPTGVPPFVPPPPETQEGGLAELDTSITGKKEQPKAEPTPATKKK